MSFNYPYSNKFKKYLNQSVTWKKKIGQDQYGKPIFEESTILVRIVAKNRLTLDQYGKEVISDHTVTTIEDVNVEDWIDNDEVINVLNAVDKKGNIVAKEVLL